MSLGSQPDFNILFYNYLSEGRQEDFFINKPAKMK